MKLMSLNMEPFSLMEPTSAPDGESGTVTTYTAGTPFQAAALIGQTAQSVVSNRGAQTAQMPDPKQQYAIYTSRAVSLPFHAIVKRLSDGQFFRITSDPTDSMTPKGALLDLRLYAAEKWKMPDGAEVIPAQTEPSSDTPEPTDPEGGGGNDES